MKKAAALGLSLALTASMTLPALAVEAMPISAKVGYDTAITLNGKVLDTAVVYPTYGERQEKEAIATLAKLIRRRQLVPRGQHRLVLPGRRQHHRQLCRQHHHRGRRAGEGQG